MSLALNCNTHSSEDVEVISNLIRMRLKTKPLANHYLNCIKYVHVIINLQYYKCIYKELNTTHSVIGRCLCSVRVQTHG